MEHNLVEECTLQIFSTYACTYGQEFIYSKFDMKTNIKEWQEVIRYAVNNLAVKVIRKFHNLISETM